MPSRKPKTAIAGLVYEIDYFSTRPITKLFSAVAYLANNDGLLRELVSRYPRHEGDADAIVILYECLKELVPERQELRRKLNVELNYRDEIKRERTDRENSPTDIKKPQTR